MYYIIYIFYFYIYIIYIYNVNSNYRFYECCQSRYVKLLYYVCVRARVCVSYHLYFRHYFLLI